MESIWNFWCAHGFKIALIIWAIVLHLRQNYIKECLEFDIRKIREYDLKFSTPYYNDKYDLLKRQDMDYMLSRISERISILETKVEERTKDV